MCDAPNRLNAQTICLHPFFRGVDWENIRSYRAPFLPKLKSIIDTSYFPVEEVAHVPPALSSHGTVNPSKELAFVGYTFKRWETLRNDL